MNTNPYAPPTAELSTGAQGQLPRTGAAILAGSACWLIYLGIVRLAGTLIWDPLLGDPHPDWVLLELTVDAAVVFIVSALVVSQWRTQPWWLQWLAFVSGVVICVIAKAYWQRSGLDLALGILSRAAFITCAAASALTFFLRRNRSLS